MRADRPTTISTFTTCGRAHASREEGEGGGREEGKEGERVGWRRRWRAALRERAPSKLQRRSNHCNQARPN
jgi:hypothetical protein